MKRQSGVVFVFTKMLCSFLYIVLYNISHQKDITQLPDIQGMVKLDGKFKIVEKLDQKENKPNLN